MSDFCFCVPDVSLKYKYGRLVLEVPLPSRNEKCLFFLRPMLMSVGDLISDLRREDPGVTASVLSKGMTHTCNWVTYILQALSVWLDRVVLQPGLAGCI